MGSIDKFCESMVHWCTEMDMRYGQGNSAFPLPRYDFRYGGSTDCSAMVAHCLNEAGFDVPSTIWSGNTCEALEKIGWTRKVPKGEPPRGAVLVNYANHVGMTVGGGKICEFGGDPHYGYDTYHGWYDYPWNAFMVPPEQEEDEPEEEEDEMVMMSMACIYQPNDEKYLVYYDGHENHQLHHPDEVEGINLVYRNCQEKLGVPKDKIKDIPMFELGTKEAPWATRFMDACSHPAPKYTPFIVK